MPMNFLFIDKFRNTPRDIGRMFLYHVIMYIFAIILIITYVQISTSVSIMSEYLIACR